VPISKNIGKEGIGTKGRNTQDKLRIPKSSIKCSINEVAGAAKKVTEKGSPSGGRGHKPLRKISKILQRREGKISCGRTRRTLSLSQEEEKGKEI